MNQHRPSGAVTREVRTYGLHWVLWGALFVSPCGYAADIGGWFADQERPKVQGADSQVECAHAIRDAASATSAVSAYRAALCYLQAETPDTLAATAWLTRAAELKFLPADRLLRSLQAAQAGPHSAARHCHDLGDGRQICHGGAAPAAAPKQ